MFPSPYLSCHVSSILTTSYVSLFTSFIHVSLRMSSFPVVACYNHRYSIHSTDHYRSILVSNFVPLSIFVILPLSWSFSSSPCSFLSLSVICLLPSITFFLLTFAETSISPYLSIPLYQCICPSHLLQSHQHSLSPCLSMYIFSHFV